MKEELEAVLASKGQRLLVEMERFVRSWDRTSRLSPVEAVVLPRGARPKTALMKREKRKKKRRRRTRRGLARRSLRSLSSLMSVTILDSS